MKKRVTKYPCRRTVRIPHAEDEKLQLQATIARILVTEYMRRKFFGGRHIIARTNDLAIRELRRLGGLLKHNFLMASKGNQPKAWRETRETLKKIQAAIAFLSKENAPSVTPTRTTIKYKKLDDPDLTPNKGPRSRVFLE